MIFQILDRQFNTLATMDNSLAGAIHFFDDEFHQYLNEGVSTFNFSVLRNHADTEYLVEGNYIYFTSKSRDYLMTIRRIEADEWQLDISTEDLSFDLINEYAAPYKATAARKITAYLNDILVDSDVVIGLNEVSSYTRKLEWTGESTVLERVLSIMTKFDAECEFITELNPDRSLKQITLNIYHKYDDKHQGVGVDRTDVELRLGENVRTVKKTTDITELYTSIRPVGNEGVNIKNIEETIKDENGVVLFYTKKGSEYIYAPVANDRFGRKHAEKGGYINMPYEFDTDSATTLYGNALSNLKKYSEPAVTYEVEGYYDLNIGDVVSIADNGYSPMLLLEARVAELIVSFCNPENNKTVFSNYRVFDSQISSSLLEIMEQMKEDVDYAVQVAKTPIFNISSKGSTIFKNGEGSVELSASVERANTDVTSEYSIFNWIKQNKDGSVDNEWTANHENYGKTVVITPADFNDTATFHYEAVKEDKLYIGGSATVTKVFDGEDGKTPIKGVDYFDGQDGTNGLSAYLHIKYSQNADGNPMTSDPTGAKYVGMQASQNPTPSTVPADYDWTLVKGADGIPGETGPDGKTSYLHIKYSDDGGKTLTANNGETVGQWLGQYVDFESADSTDVSKYAWSKIKGDTGDDGQTPVVHQAWSWSADGTNRFTTVYPGENLITGGWEINGLIWATGAEASANNRKRTGFFEVGANTQYVFSRDGSRVSVNVFEYDENKVFIGTGGESSSGKNKIVTKTETKFLRLIMLNNVDLTELIKCEEGVTPTIYTPEPSEDYANAYPLYEGTYTDYSETASQNPADYTWRRIIGESGQDSVAGADGKGIKSTAVTYQASTSGTVAPTGTWVANPPTVAKGQYLWTRTIWTYTDNATETGYSVAYVAKDGNDGSDGVAGKDGVGIKSTAITYAVSSSGTTAPTSGWVASPPTATAGQFMWTRTVWTYTDNTTETGYSVGKIGDTGPQGPQGITGPKGEDGKQYYTWLKYADSPTTGMSDSPTNKKYMGLAYNKTTATESANYADYTWSLIQGPQGNQGIQGPAGANGQPTYTWIKYGTSASGAGLSDDPTGKTYIGMAYNKTTATESTNAADYTWSLIQGPKGDNGISVTSVTEEYYVSTSDTEQTGGEWSTTVPNNANPNLYVWRRGKNTMSDGTVSYTTPALIQGMTGIYPYIGPTQPANPKEGQQWWKSDESGNITDFYVYKSGSWQGQTIQQSVLNIIALNAVTITGSTITGTNVNGGTITGTTINGGTITGTTVNGGTVNGSTFKSTWSGNVYTSPTATRPATGTTTIDKGNFTTTWKSTDNAWAGNFVINPSGEVKMSRVSTNASTGVVTTKGYNLTSDKLELINTTDRSDLSYSGELTAKMLAQMATVGTVLWTGALYMQATQSIVPTIPIGDCMNGWILAFTPYKDGAGTNADWNYTFVSKTHADVGFWAQLVWDTNTRQPKSKYLYLSDGGVRLAGHASNANDGMVIRKVIAW